MIRVGILTVSDLGSRGEREDTAGRALGERAEGMGWVVECYEIVPDERDVISDRLREWADDAGLELILTTGGTGFADRDVTPEATLEVLDKQAPGIPEAMRAAGLKKTPMAILSRGVAGIRGRTLIVNLPGSMKGAVESFEAVRRSPPPRHRRHPRTPRPLMPNCRGGRLPESSRAPTEAHSGKGVRSQISTFGEPKVEI